MRDRNNTYMIKHTTKAEGVSRNYTLGDLTVLSFFLSNFRAAKGSSSSELEIDTTMGRRAFESLGLLDALLMSPAIGATKRVTFPTYGTEGNLTTCSGPQAHHSTM